jgi:hypothetical protein
LYIDEAISVIRTSLERAGPEGLRLGDLHGQRPFMGDRGWELLVRLMFSLALLEDVEIIAGGEYDHQDTLYRLR